MTEMTKEELSKLVWHRRREGMSIAAIAEETGKNKTTIYKITCRNPTPGLVIGQVTRKVGEYIFKHFNEHGRSPTIREIGSNVKGLHGGNLSTSVVSKHLRILVDLDIISLGPYGESRRIKIVDAQYIVPSWDDVLERKLSAHEETATP